MNYFINFPKEPYKIGGQEFLATNLTAAGRVRQLSLENAVEFSPYVIQEGERPDGVSQKLYGDSKYAWILLLINNIGDIYQDWPKSNATFERYIIQKYGSVQSARVTTHSFVTTDGVVVSAPEASRYGATRKTQYEYEVEKNDGMREINVVVETFIEPLSTEIRRLFAS